MSGEKTLRDVFEEISEEAWRSEEIQTVYDFLRDVEMLDHIVIATRAFSQMVHAIRMGGDHIVEFENLLKKVT